MLCLVNSNYCYLFVIAAVSMRKSFFRNCCVKVVLHRPKFWNSWFRECKTRRQSNQISWFRRLEKHWSWVHEHWTRAHSSLINTRDCYPLRRLSATGNEKTQLACKIRSAVEPNPLRISQLLDQSFSRDSELNWLNVRYQNKSVTCFVVRNVSVSQVCNYLTQGKVSLKRE